MFLVDPQIAGISGDMLLCSLVDMGADGSNVIEKVTAASAFLEGAGIRDIGFSKVAKRGLSSTALKLELRDDRNGRAGAEVKGCIERVCAEAGLSADAGRFARRSIDTLIASEAKIHGQEYGQVRLHEAASLDTVVDIVGTAVAMDGLGLFAEEAFCCPVAVGGGKVSFSHGTMSNPAAAVLEILRGTGITVAGGPVQGEFTTPTGASMLASLDPVCSEYYPPVQVERTGYGAGARDYEGFANVLKVVLGKGAGGTREEAVHVLETNVDDVSGEIVGVAVERLMDGGALDVTVVPGLTKKGRPTNLITVICDAGSAERLTRLLMEETGTLGVRMRSSRRVAAPRQTGTADVLLDGRSYKVRYKTHGATGRLKIEADDVGRVSAATGRPFAVAEELIRGQVRRILDEGQD